MDRTEAMKQALEITKAQASVRNMTAEEITGMVTNLTASIMGMGEVAVTAEAAAPAMDPKKSITESGVVCLECGKKFKVLTKKHLVAHGLTPAQYREKYGYKKTQTLAAKSLVRARRKKMQDMKLWERRRKPAVAVAQ